MRDTVTRWIAWQFRRSMSFLETAAEGGKLVAVRIAHTGGIEVRGVVQSQAGSTFGTPAAGKCCGTEIVASFHERAGKAIMLPLPTVAAC
jgi:hypothetical protein